MKEVQKDGKCMCCGHEECKLYDELINQVTPEFYDLINQITRLILNTATDKKNTDKHYSVISYAVIKSCAIAAMGTFVDVIKENVSSKEELDEMIVQFMSSTRIDGLKFAMGFIEARRPAAVLDITEMFDKFVREKRAKEKKKVKEARENGTYPEA